MNKIHNAKIKTLLSFFNIRLRNINMIRMKVIIMNQRSTTPIDVLINISKGIIIITEKIYLIILSMLKILIINI